jgi:hypothetical protein
MKSYYIDVVYRCQKCERLVGVVYKENETVPLNIICIECDGFTDEQINAGMDDLIREQEIKQHKKPWEQIGISRSTYYRDQRRSKLNNA